MGHLHIGLRETHFSHVSKDLSILSVTLRGQINSEVRPSSLPTSLGRQGLVFSVEEMCANLFIFLKREHSLFGLQSLGGNISINVCNTSVI